MGEARRKWTSVFEGGGFPKARIVRKPWPGDVALEMKGMARDIAEHPKGLLCYNRSCQNKIEALPEAVVFMRTSREAPHGLCMGICGDCAKHGDEEVFGVLRDHAKVLGLGPVSLENGARMDLPVGGLRVAEDLPGGVVVVQWTAKEGDERSPVMEALVRLIEEGRLPTFVALWGRGARNCHAIVDVLLEELEGQGLGGVWKAASGFSGVRQRDGTPIGLHSWIEAGE
jgi:hypothetical protein